MIALSEALLFASLGLAVRLQLALLKGFDLVVAVCVLIAAELTVLTAGSSWSQLAISLVVAVAASCLVIIPWNIITVNSDRFGRSKAAASIFVVSLGLTTLSSGVVGLLRGGGLRQPLVGIHVFRISFLPGSAILAVGGSIVVLLALFLWLRSKVGVGLDLYSQNTNFALEIGIEPRRLAVGTAIMVGVCTGFAGWYFALSSGSTPEIGFTAFLYGAGAALLLPRRRPLAALLGGLLLGSFSVLLQLFLAPSLSMGSLYGVVVVLLISRGTSRNQEVVR